MILPDSDILYEIENKNLLINPFHADSIGPSSLKLHLGGNIYALRNNVYIVDIKNEDSYPKLEKMPIEKDKSIILERGKVYLAPTLEKVGFGNNLAGFIDGSTNLARLGISIVFSNYVACGFGYPTPGVLTLEITIHGSSFIKLYTGMQICNLLVFRLSKKPKKPYGAQKWNHSGESDAIGSLLYMKFREEFQNG